MKITAVANERGFALPSRENSLLKCLGHERDTTFAPGVTRYAAFYQLVTSLLVHSIEDFNASFVARFCFHFVNVPQQQHGKKQSQRFSLDLGEQAVGPEPFSESRQ